MHSKNNQKQTAEIDANIGNKLRVDIGNRSRGKGKIGEGGKLRMFNILILLTVTWCVHMSKFFKLCTDMCILLYVFHIKIKMFILKKTHSYVITFITFDKSL